MPDAASTDEPVADAGEPAAAPDDETTEADPTARPSADSEPPPGADPDNRDPDQAGSEHRETSPSGTPGIPPPVHDERRSEDGLMITTTTGDPAKDFRGPTVAEESREELDAPALDEPGYADLGHAEDFEVLHKD